MKDSRITFAQGLLQIFTLALLIAIMFAQQKINIALQERIQELEARAPCDIMFAGGRQR
jgi:hypothetical protein